MLPRSRPHYTFYGKPWHPRCDCYNMGVDPHSMIFTRHETDGCDEQILLRRLALLRGAFHVPTGMAGLTCE